MLRLHLHLRLRSRPHVSCRRSPGRPRHVSLGFSHSFRHVQDVLYMDTHAAPRVDGAYSSPPGAHAARCAQPAHPQPAPSRATAEASDALIRRLSGGEHGEGGGPSCHNYVPGLPHVSS